MNISNLSIRVRLGVGFLLVLLIPVFLAVMAIVRVDQINHELTTIGDVNSVKQRYAINFRGSVHDRAIALRDVTLEQEPQQVERQVQLIQKLADDYARSAAPLEEFFSKPDLVDEDERRALADIKRIEAMTLPLTQTVIDLRRAGNQSEAVGILLGQARPAYEDWLRSINVYIDMKEAKNKQASALARSTGSGFLALMLITTALAISLGGLIAWRITRSVAHPVAQALALTKQVEQGDFTSRVNADQQDEFGDLLHALEKMKKSLSHTVLQIREAADGINTTSAEIASGNQDLSARTEQTASNLEETAASMEQLTSTVRQSADSARQANQLAVSASEIATRGGNVVGQVVTTMNEINASSKKISDIISVIDGIAFQTNILALNAAVEAARAGEQGRGFAVVAAEVRSLAQRSAEAAKEIKGLIGSSVDRVEAGSRLVAQAGQTMSEIVDSARRVGDIIGEITAAAGEQSDGIGQVNVAVSQLDQMTQQNAALVEESTAAAESLKDQATRLAQVVQIFRIDGLVSQTLSAPLASGPKAQPRKALTPAQPLSAVTRQPAAALLRPALAKKAPAPSQPALGKPVTAATSANEGDWEKF